MGKRRQGWKGTRNLVDETEVKDVWRRVEGQGKSKWKGREGRKDTGKVGG